MIDFSIKDFPAQADQAGPYNIQSSARKTELKAADSHAGAVKEAGPDELEKIASDVQIKLKRLNTELRFEVKRDSNEVVVKIIDHETKEVIRQIPSEELLAIRKRMNDLIGVLYDAQT